MADGKDSQESFLRKVVRFVSNPTTDWADLNTRPAEQADQSAELSELKAMVERKRRNDFVRKREFDMLRRVRRDGLSSEQLAALGTSSHLDDSDVQNSDLGPRQDASVKAKIDHIEREMVGDSDLRRPAGPASTLGPPSQLGSPASVAAGSAPLRPGGSGAPSRPAVLPPLPPALAAGLSDRALADGSPLLPGLELGASAGAPGPRPPLSPPSSFGSAPATSAVLPPLPPTPGLAPLAPLGLAGSSASPDPAAPFGGTTSTHPETARAAAPLASLQGGPSKPTPLAIAPSSVDISLDVQVSEAVHDPELDEAVMAFANADYSQCESALLQLTSPTGPRGRHPDTWLVLFDLYRAIGQQQRFESLATDFALQFGTSAPQWISLPKLASEAMAEERRKPSRQAGEAGWQCPESLTAEVVTGLKNATLQMPMPWVLDWSEVREIEPSGAMALCVLLRTWSTQRLDIQWMGTERLMTTLAQASPTGKRDAPEVYWLARLEATRLANRADQFDDIAIDYCVTYEVSPPAWEPSRCTLGIIGPTGMTTRGPTLSMMSGLSRGFAESGMVEDEDGAVQVGTVELTGQLVGDQSNTLKGLDEELEGVAAVRVSCARLIRVDFVAAGDLLNWVITKSRQGRPVQFIDAHRLVALFFGAMGISEHAKVGVRTV